MADRGSLHKSHLVEFTAFMIERGYSSEKTGDGYEVRRFVNRAIKGPMRTVLVFERENAKQHLSMQDKDWPIFNDFMRYLRNKKSSQ